MTNKEKYTQAFVNALHVEEETATKLKYQETKDWDSVGHMNLIAEIESTFDIMLDTEDIIEFSSYEKGMELLKKYDLEF